MRRLVHVMIAAGLVLCFGCKGSGKKARLVSDAELATLKSEHAKRLDAHLAKSCKRPVLRGTAIAGSGTKALLAFTDAKKGPHAACLDSMKGFDDVTGLLLNCAKGQDMRNCAAQSLAEEPKKDEIKGVLAKCGDTLAAMQKAVSHGEVCSPFRPTKGPKDPQFLGYIRAAQIAGFQALQLARDGKATSALDLVFDTVRLTQDVSRPGANLITGMIAVASLRAPLAATEGILNAKIEWKKADVDAAVAQADKLRASQVPWGETMVGEGLFMIDEFAGKLAGNAKDKPKGKSMDLNPEDELGVTWLALRSTAAANERECVGKSIKECIDGTDRVRKSTALELEVTKKLEPDPSKVKAHIRKRIVAILKDIASASMSKYAMRHAGGVGRITALRAHLEYVRMTVDGKKCPDAKAAIDAMKPLLVSKELGTPLTAFAAPDGTIELRLPEWAVYNNKKTPNPERLTIWHVRCPK